LYIQTLTQTADTQARRNSISVKDPTLNERCLFCDECEESLRHIFTCRKSLEEVAQQMNKVKDSLAEIKGLELDWFCPHAQQQDLWKDWEALFPLFKKEDEQEMKRILNRIQKHDRFAGIIGIMPKGIEQLLTTYLHRSTNVSPEAGLQTARKRAQDIVRRVRTQLMEVSMAIWRRWKYKQRTWRRMKITAQAKAKTTSSLGVDSTRPSRGKRKKTEKLPRKRPTGRDRDPRIHGVKNKRGKRAPGTPVQRRRKR
jgi:hypothetical protein